MPYVPISDITLKTDWIARDITIINFNQILLEIKNYLATMKYNLDWIEAIDLGDYEFQAGFYFGDEPPTDTEVLWFDTFEY